MIPVQKKEDFYKSGFPKQIHRNKYSLPINDRLKNARNRKGFSLSRTIQELDKNGVKCGLSTLQGYEANESSLNHRYPSLSMIMALSDLYDCSIDYLFGISNEIARPTDNLKEILKESEKITWDNQVITEDEKTKIVNSINRILGKKK